jgi:hypothetical protein
METCSVTERHGALDIVAADAGANGLVILFGAPR